MNKEIERRIHSGLRSVLAEIMNIDSFLLDSGDKANFHHQIRCAEGLVISCLNKQNALIVEIEKK